MVYGMIEGERRNTLVMNTHGNNHPANISLSVRDTAWLAGWLEGEGSFMYHGKKNVQVYFSCTDKDIMDRLAKLMKYTGNIHARMKKEGWKMSYSFCITGNKAVRVMELIRPYMGERRGEKIDELLWYRKNVLYNYDAVAARWNDPRERSKQSILMKKIWEDKKKHPKKAA